MRVRSVVLLAALCAVVGRFCGLLWPLRPDEAGFLLVARAWDPQPDSLYGPYFVDRPPLLIALVKATDDLAGPLGFRMLAALGCGVAVLLASALVHEVARHRNLVRARASGAEEHEAGRRLARVRGGVAILTAAFLVTPQIDAVGAKGELLGVPVILASCLLALRALRLPLPTAAVNAVGAGLVGAVALGLKQSLAGGLVFGAVLLLVALVRRERPRRQLAVLAGAALIGAAVPVAATVLWAVQAGVHLETLQYAVISFRSDASQIIADVPNASNRTRSWLLFGHFLLCCMALVSLWGVFAARHAAPRLPGPVLAAAAMLTVDLAVVGLSGSFWTPYLFTIIPSSVLLWTCVRVTSALPDEGVLPPSSQWRPRLASAIVASAAVSSGVLLAGWVVVVWLLGPPPEHEVNGREIARLSVPGESMVVYGGRADLQVASGLDSPYPHLWSLPMRTMDPDLADLHDLLAGGQAPEWFATVVPLSAWDGLGRRALGDVVAQRYVRVGGVCGDHPLYRLRDAPPVPRLAGDCATPWGQR